jgi:regulatory protein
VAAFRRARPRPPDVAGDPPGDLPGARRALAALFARRDHSATTARERLARLGFEGAVIEASIAEFQRSRVIDDARYAQRLMEYHLRRGQGPARIREALQREGLPPQTVEAALAEAPDWREQAREARRRRFGAEAPEGWAERSRQARFLQSRGFSSDHIRSAQGIDLDLSDE